MKPCDNSAVLRTEPGQECTDSDPESRPGRACPGHPREHAPARLRAEANGYAQQHTQNVMAICGLPRMRMEGLVVKRPHADLLRPCSLAPTMTQNRKLGPQESCVFLLLKSEITATLFRWIEQGGSAKKGATPAATAGRLDARGRKFLTPNARNPLKSPDSKK
jgi:hypothetical protein